MTDKPPSDWHHEYIVAYGWDHNYVVVAHSSSPCAQFHRRSEVDKQFRGKGLLLMKDGTLRG
jgi:hypothetical protein